LYIYSTDILLHIIIDGLHEIGSIALVHVLSEQNIRANFMAKEGSHSRCSVYWNCPPPGLESLILRDKLGT
jgi:hypothetical protein